MPNDPDPQDKRLEREAAQTETMGWLKASEGAFAFWDNSEDAVWDEVTTSQQASKDQ
jgi:hypothetical protein